MSVWFWGPQKRIEVSYVIFKQSDSYNRRRVARRRRRNVLLILLLLVALPLGIFAYKPIMAGFRAIGSGLSDLWNRQPTPPGGHSETDRSSASSGKSGEKPVAPAEIKAVYLAPGQLVSEELDSTVSKLKESGVNAVVIDIKTAAGILMYNSSIELAKTVEAISEEPLPLSSIVNRFKENGFYTIARIMCFKDNKVTRKRLDMTVQAVGGGQWWYNYQKYLNAFVKSTWDYLTEIGAEAADMGFDEVMLDEVRFPDRGSLHLIDYGEYKNASKADAINGFIAHITDALHRKKVKVSLVLTPYAAFEDDNGESGQDIDFAALKADYLSPHFEISGFKRSGSSVVTVGESQYKGAEKNFEPILSTAVKLTSQRLKESGCKAVLRPWLQAYNSGSLVFSADVIHTQIELCRQNGAYGYLLYNEKGEYPKDGVN